MDADTKSPITLESLAADIRFLHETLVKSFNHVATKEDLASFATKDDLALCATKEDLKSVKQELKTEIRLLRNTLQGHVAERKDIPEILGSSGAVPAAA